MARFGDVARTLGFARLPSSGYGSHEFLVAYDEPTDRWLKVDAVTELAFGTSFALRLPPPAAAACLDRRRPDGPAFVLDPGDGFWTLLLHGLLDKTAVEDAARARLRELVLAGGSGGPVAAALAPLLPDGWSLERVVEAVSGGDWAGLGRLGRERAAPWRRRDTGESLRRRVAGPVRLRAGRLARVRRPRGLGLVLVGESTLTARLAAKLGRDLPLPVRTPTLPGSRRAVARGLRDRQRLGQCLVIFRAGALDDLPNGWTGATSAGRGVLAEALSSPAPDLVILLAPAGSPASSGETAEIRTADRPDLRTVDASVSEERLGRMVARLVWEHLAERWNALDGRSAQSS